MAALYGKDIPGVAARGGFIISYPWSTARTYTKGLATARGSTTQHGLLTATGQTDVYHEEDNRANQNITRLTHASPWSKENLSLVRRQGPNMSRGEPRSLRRYTQGRNISCPLLSHP